MLLIIQITQEWMGSDFNLPARFLSEVIDDISTIVCPFNLSLLAGVRRQCSFADLLLCLLGSPHREELRGDFVRFLKLVKVFRVQILRKGIDVDNVRNIIATFGRCSNGGRIWGSWTQQGKIFRMIVKGQPKGVQTNLVASPGRVGGRVVCGHAELGWRSSNLKRGREC